jgi:hypothetical protein
MKLRLKTPFKFANGEATTLSLADNVLKVKDMLQIAKLGGIENKKAQAYIFTLLTVNDGAFKLTESDYLKYNGLALHTIVMRVHNDSRMVNIVSKDFIKKSTDLELIELYQNAAEFDNESYYFLDKGERLVANPLLEQSVIKLTSPIEVEVNGSKEQISLVCIKNRSYGDLEGEITKSNASSLMIVRSFIKNYLEPYNHENEDLLPNTFQISDSYVDNLTIKDFYRIEALLYSPFIVADLDLLELVEE